MHLHSDYLRRGTGVVASGPQRHAPSVPPNTPAPAPTRPLSAAVPAAAPIRPFPDLRSLPDRRIAAKPGQDKHGSSHLVSHVDGHVGNGKHEPFNSQDDSSLFETHRMINESLRSNISERTVTLSAVTLNGSSLHVPHPNTPTVASRREHSITSDAFASARPPALLASPTAASLAGATSPNHRYSQHNGDDGFTVNSVAVTTMRASSPLAAPLDRPSTFEGPHKASAPGAFPLAPTSDATSLLRARDIAALLSMPAHRPDMLPARPPTSRSTESASLWPFAGSTTASEAAAAVTALLEGRMAAGRADGADGRGWGGSYAPYPGYALGGDLPLAGGRMELAARGDAASGSRGDDASTARPDGERARLDGPTRIPRARPRSHTFDGE